MERKNTEIIKAYYNTVGTLLEYSPCRETVAIEREILSLLFAFADRSEQFDGCWENVQKAQRIQTCTDEMLLDAGEIGYDILSDIKMQTLSALNISKQKKFDAVLFADTVRERADNGLRADCKLLACMNWLGTAVPQNRHVALKIWSLLAASGDFDATQMLIGGYERLGNTAQAEKWRHVLDILRTEYDSFSPVALRSRYAAYSEEELELANLILFATHKSMSATARKIDRPMLTYLLESGESYASKMRRLHDDTNYSYLLYIEDRYAGRHFGF